MIRVATIQFQHRPGDKEYNLGRVRHYCDAAKAEGAGIACFPEMCITGYWHVRNLSRQEIEGLSEPVPGGPSTATLSDLAVSTEIIIGAGLIEKDQDGTLYNTYAVCLPDGRVEKHRKLHCFISEHMASGDSYTVFDTDLGLKLGVLICYDNNIVENARITALKGADILLAPHQTGGTDSGSPHALGKIDLELWHRREEDPAAIDAELRGGKGRAWLMRWLPARAHDNGMFIVYSNGIGIDDDEVRTGNAMVIDCYGRILNETNVADDAMVVADLDLSLLTNCTGRRWMRARRPDLYGPISEPTGREVDARTARFTGVPEE